MNTDTLWSLHYKEREVFRLVPGEGLAEVNVTVIFHRKVALAFVCTRGGGFLVLPFVVIAWNNHRIKETP